MLYINFWSEQHLSIQFDGICHSSTVLPVWMSYFAGGIHFILQQTFSDLPEPLQKISHYILDY